MSDELTQKVEWKTRLVRALVDHAHDDETLLAMLEAGLDQAHSEGLHDAAVVCQQVADAVPASHRVASVLAKAIRELDMRNIAGRAAAQASGGGNIPIKSESSKKETKPNDAIVLRHL